MAKKRWIIEGTWTGYTAGQRRVIHRAVTTDPDRYKVTYVEFSDNTGLAITKRECRLRERVKEMHTYDRVLNKCIAMELSGIVTIDRLRQTRRGDI